MDWYLGVLKKYTDFSGRARRKEYWFFFLFNLLIALALTLVGRAIDTNILYVIYSLGVLLPSLAVAVRRLHDTGRSGWWLLIVLIPILGALALLVFMVLDSEAGQNAYGPSPKTA